MRAAADANDPPYGTERCYNALRLAHALAKRDSASEATVFLMADAVLAAKAPAWTRAASVRGGDRVRES